MSEQPANPWRGEASIMVANRARLLRPSFSALVAAEEELGPLFALVDRAGGGQLRLAELVALFWHCLADRDGVNRAMLGDAVMEAGLAKSMPTLRRILEQILQGAE